jgi:16S rRNA processing protein RimM
MKSVDRKDFIIAGVIEKIHGTKGELKIGFNQKVSLKEWVFIEINQKPVPFFIEKKSIQDLQVIVKLEGINTIQDAEKYLNLNILAPKEKRNIKAQEEDIDLIGFVMIDNTVGEIGTIETIDELPMQLIFKTTFKGKELLIPAVNDFIIEINDKNKTIHLNLPEGLIEL